MADIQVIFPKGNAPIILNQAEILSSAQHVTWCVTTNDARIHSVEVKFDDPQADFFAGKKKDQWNNTDPCEYRQVLNSWKADFYGHVPQYAGATKPVMAKYTVRAFDKKGKLVPGTEVDPVIITPKP